MTVEYASAHDPRIQEALIELKGLIRQKYPTATFVVSRGDDPEGVYLTSTVDVDDTEEVFDVVVDRLLKYQIEDELPIFVVAVRPLERVLKDLRSPRRVRPRPAIRDIEDVGPHL